MECGTRYCHVDDKAMNIPISAYYTAGKTNNVRTELARLEAAAAGFIIQPLWRPILHVNIVTKPNLLRYHSNVTVQQSKGPSFLSGCAILCFAMAVVEWSLLWFHYFGWRFTTLYGAGLEALTKITSLSCQFQVYCGLTVLCSGRCSQLCYGQWALWAALRDKLALLWPMNSNDPRSICGPWSLVLHCELHCVTS